MKANEAQHSSIHLKNLFYRTRRQSMRRREIYVLSVCPYLIMFVGEFDAKSSGARRDQRGRIRTTLKYTSETRRRQENTHPALTRQGAERNSYS